MYLLDLCIYSLHCTTYNVTQYWHWHRHIFWSRERILKTIKKLDNFIWTNRKQVKFCFNLPIGPNKIVKLFSCLIVYKIRSQRTLRCHQLWRARNWQYCSWLSPKIQTKIKIWNQRLWKYTYFIFSSELLSENSWTFYLKISIFKKINK